MKSTKLLLTTPTTKAQRLGILISLTILTILTFAGLFGFSYRLASRSTSFPPFKDTNLRNMDQGPVVSILPSNEPGVLEAVPMPEGILTPWDGSGRVTLLLMGLDYRDWSAGEGPSRTDTMMLLTLDPLNNTAGMMSIPRDLWVSIPGFDNGRINTAYFLGEAYQMPGGGPGLAVQTVEQLLGVEINYYAQVDFGAFTRFVDELGGLEIDVPKKIKIDPIVGDTIKLKPERQVLNGELALAYARARNTSGGDFDRAQRQQQVIFAIRDRLVDPDSLSILISKAPTLYAEIASGVQTNLSLEELIKLAILAQKVPDANISREAISTQEVVFAESPDGQSVLIPLPEDIRQLRDEVFLVSTSTLGPLLPGTLQERMVIEGARIKLLNGSLVDGLARRTQATLQDFGAVIVEISNGEYTEHTRIVDYTGNPHTAQYLTVLFDIQPGYYTLDYDPDSPVDMVVTLGVDWSAKEVQAFQPVEITEPSQEAGMTTYQDDFHGFALNYPSSWSQMKVQTGERGSITAIASWKMSSENSNATPPGETRLDISVLQWEPLSLDAFVLQRKTAWGESGISVLNEEKQILQSGLPIVEFRVIGVDGNEAYFLLTVIGDRFVTLSGSGDFEIIKLVGKSLRSISNTSTQ
jgi:LCP family protein required for cell wall assembly